MVQVIRAETPQITRTAFWGCPEGETCDTHLEKGSTPSRATAKTSLEEATIAIAVFCCMVKCKLSVTLGRDIFYKKRKENVWGGGCWKRRKRGAKLTNHSATMHTMFMTMCPY